MSKKEKKPASKGKKIVKGILCTFLALIVICGGVIGYGVNIGMNHARGPLSFLLYLQAPKVLTEQQYEVEVSEIEVVNDGETIRGHLFMPKDNRDTREVIIFSHGFNCQSDLLKNKATSIAQAGIPVVTYDFRGGSSKGQSDGDTKNMSLDTEISDLNAIIETVKGYDWTDDNNIFLMGESFGGMVSALVGAERNDIAAMALCFPALNSADNARINFASIDDIPDETPVGDMTTGKGLWVSLYNRDIYEDIKAYEGDVLLLHGTKDTSVPYESSVKANEGYKNSELITIEGAGHGFGGKDAETSLKAIYDFVKAHATV